jgi:hypothetical protein
VVVVVLCITAARVMCVGEWGGGGSGVLPGVNHQCVRGPSGQIKYQYVLLINLQKNDTDSTSRIRTDHRILFFCSFITFCPILCASSRWAPCHAYSWYHHSWHQTIVRIHKWYFATNWTLCLSHPTEHVKVRLNHF